MGRGPEPAQACPSSGPVVESQAESLDGSRPAWPTTQSLSSQALFSGLLIFAGARRQWTRAENPEGACQRGLKNLANHPLRHPTHSAVPMAKGPQIPDSPCLLTLQCATFMGDTYHLELYLLKNITNFENKKNRSIVGLQYC